MKEGDFAGLALLQKKYGLVGVKAEGGVKKLVMVSAQTDKPEEVESLPLNQNTVFLKATCNFVERADEADFYYSLDGKKWVKIAAGSRWPIPFRTSWDIASASSTMQRRRQAVMWTSTISVSLESEPLSPRLLVSSSPCFLRNLNLRKLSKQL